VVESVEDAYRLANGAPAITSINIGGMKATEDRKQISKAVFVSENDVKMMKELGSKGIELEVRLVPSDIKQNALKLI
ncbi:PTS sugar transporter subunit IIB, partial [Clostridium perfringens]